MLLTTFILTTLMLSVRGVDECGDRCTSTQVCANDGTCMNKSDLVKCGSGYLSYYCYKGQECCGFQGCMPAGAVCCNSIIYCPSNHTCCGTMYCCEEGTFCDGNGHCILDEYSTRKPPTTKSVETRTPTTARTLYPTTRAKTPFSTSRTRYPTFKTTRWFNDYTTKSSFRTSSTSTFKWWYGVVTGAAVVTFAIVIAAVIWNRRRCASNAPSQSGKGGMVLSAPVQVYGHPPGKSMPRMAPNTGVTVHTNGQPPKPNAAFLVTKKGIPAQTNRKPPNQGTVFVITKTGV